MAVTITRKIPIRRKQVARIMEERLEDKLIGNTFSNSQAQIYTPNTTSTVHVAAFRPMQPSAVHMATNSDDSEYSSKSKTLRQYISAHYVAHPEELPRYRQRMGEAMKRMGLL